MSTHGKLTLLACISLATAVAGCGGQPAKAPQPAKPAAAPSPAPPKPTTAPGHLARHDVDRVLRQGPPWILRRVPVEEVIRAGAFIGWKILAMPEGFRDVELKPGDVVTKVNGTTLERPDDLFAAWRLLASASELRIAYEREGAERELVMPIDGPPSPDTQKAIDSNAPPRRPTESRKRGTTVIEEDTGSPFAAEEE